MKPEFSRQIFGKKYSNIKFHENPSSGSGIIPCGRTDKPTDMTKLIIAFFFVILRDAPKNCIYDFAQVTARSTFKRRSAHSGLYARSNFTRRSAHSGLYARSTFTRRSAHSGLYARSNFTRRSAHSGLYARSTNAQRAVLRKISSQYSWRSERLVATLNAGPQVVKQPQAVFYIQQVYSFSIGSTPGVRTDAVRLIVQPLLPLSSDTAWLYSYISEAASRDVTIPPKHTEQTFGHIDFCSSVPPRVLTGLPNESFTGKKRVCDAGRSPAMQSIVTPVWASPWVEIWRAGKILSVIAKQDGLSVTSQF